MKKSLAKLVTKLASGYSITVTGYAKDNAALAKRRAQAVGAYLDARVKAHVTIRIVTRTTLNKVTVATTKT